MKIQVLRTTTYGTLDITNAEKRNLSFVLCLDIINLGALSYLHQL